MTFDALFPDLSRRVNVAELMDDPECSEQRLLRTVRSFALLNRLVSRYRSVLNRWLIQDMLRQPARKYRVADLGAGGCDIPVWLLSRARKLGLDLSVLAVESNPLIADQARRVHRGVAGLQVVCKDAIHIGELEPVDYIIGNHFLHHLPNDEILNFLARALEMRIRRFVFNDLCRSHRAYYLHSLLAAVLFPRTFVGTDGRRSIRRGFRRSELRALLAKADILDRVQVHTLAPARIVIVSTRDEE